MALWCSSSHAAVVCSVPYQRRAAQYVRVALPQGRTRPGHVSRSLGLRLSVLRRHRQTGAHREILPGRTDRRISCQVAQEQP